MGHSLALFFALIVRLVYQAQPILQRSGLSLSLCRLRDGVLLFVLSLRYSADLFSSSCSRVFSPAPPFLIVPLIFPLIFPSIVPLIVPLIVPFGGILAAVISVAIYQRSGLYSISITIYPLITSLNSKKHLISCIYQKNVVPLQPQRFYNRKIISAKRVAQ